ncbi:MAG: hypothetical protein JST92_21210 [Deltaproteobacteria bacterium]|nr:hypothetical protein [Deltaproteobacteria bacterium]
MTLLRPAALALLVLSAACSTEITMTLSVTPASVPGDGETPVKVTANVMKAGGPIQDTVTVHFTSTDGTFVGAADGTPGVIDADTTSGAAIASLIPPRKGRGKFTVTAQLSQDGTTINLTKDATLVPAGQLANNLTFTCANTNVGGMVPGRTDPIRILCTAKAYKDSTEIKNASIETFAEAGHLQWLKNDSGAQQLIYTIMPGDVPPLDVDPLGPNGKARPLCPSTCGQDPANCDAEPCWVESGTGITHNPRDGLATIMVAVPGVAGFFDATTSNGEPFVDSDDDGVRSAGETYIDVNGDGKYNSADDGQGQTQDPRMLWRAVRIVWSGALYNPSPVTARNASITGAPTSGLNFQATLRIHDKNYNKLSAVGGGDDAAAIAALSCTQNGSLTLNGSGSLKLNQDTDGAGILFDENNNISAPGLPSTYRRGTEYNNAITGAIDQDSKPNHPVCTIEATLARTWAPSVPGFDSTGSSSSETVDGTITW